MAAGRCGRAARRRSCSSMLSRQWLPLPHSSTSNIPPLPLQLIDQRGMYKGRGHGKQVRHAAGARPRRAGGRLPRPRRRRAALRQRQRIRQRLCLLVQPNRLLLQLWKQRRRREAGEGCGAVGTSSEEDGVRAPPCRCYSVIPSSRGAPRAVRGQRHRRQGVMPVAKSEQWRNACLPTGSRDAATLMLLAPPSQRAPSTSSRPPAHLW